jgi:hypothetical protein
MTCRFTVALRFFLRSLIVILQAGLIVWAACLPLVWILRDGLGPDAAETGWGIGVLKAAVQWGVPALALAAPLCGLSIAERRLADRNLRTS